MRIFVGMRKLVFRVCSFICYLLTQKFSYSTARQNSAENTSQVFAVNRNFLGNPVAVSSNPTSGVVTFLKTCCKYRRGHDQLALELLLCDCKSNIGFLQKLQGENFSLQTHNFSGCYPLHQSCGYFSI